MKKIFIIFAVICLAAPAMAADWNFYGSARMATFSVNQDTDVNGSHNASQTNTLWDQQGNSRIGAKVKFNDQIGGGFEAGTSWNERKLFGTYTFGGGNELLLGQTYVPSYLGLSGSVFDDDGGLLGIGEYYESRKPMIQLTMGGFKIALISPDDTVKVTDATLADASDDYIAKVTIPEIEASYDIKTDMVAIKAFGGYQTYDLDATDLAHDTGVKDLTVTSYVLGAAGQLNFGALYVNLGGHWGQNLGNMHATKPGSGIKKLGFGGDLTNEMVVESNKEKDTTCYGAEGVVGFNASDMLTIEAGYGYEYAEVDLSDADGSNISQVYLNAVITIAPGFTITPEVGYLQFDGETFGVDPDPSPTTTYFGAKWQINF